MIYKCNIFQNLCTCMCLLEASECSLFFCEVAASQIYALLFYPSFFIGFFFSFLLVPLTIMWKLLELGSVMTNKSCFQRNMSKRYPQPLCCLGKFMRLLSRNNSKFYSLFFILCLFWVWIWFLLKSYFSNMLISLGMLLIMWPFSLRLLCIKFGESLTWLAVGRLKTKIQKYSLMFWNCTLKTLFAILCCQFYVTAWCCKSSLTQKLSLAGCPFQLKTFITLSLSIF